MLLTRVLSTLIIISNIWSNFSGIQLSPRKLQVVENWIHNKAYRRYNLNQKNFSSSVDYHMVCVLLIVMPNLSWDLAARDKQLFYNDMFDWIEDTIKWFVENNKYNLIIKPHLRRFGRYTKTFDTVKAFIDKSFKSFLLMYICFQLPTTWVSKINLHGILSWTSTSSVEYLALGFVSVTLAKGLAFGLNICIEPTVIPLPHAFIA